MRSQDAETILEHLEVTSMLVARRRLRPSCTILARIFFEIKANLKENDEDDETPHVETFLRHLERLLGLVGSRDVTNRLFMLHNLTRADNVQQAKVAVRRAIIEWTTASSSDLLIANVEKLAESLTERTQEKSIFKVGKILPIGTSIAVTKAYEVIKDHMIHECINAMEHARGTHVKHPVRLLLHSPTEHDVQQFDLLFSSVPRYFETPGCQWQDVQLSVPDTIASSKITSTGKKRVQISGENETKAGDRQSPITLEQLREIHRGTFCAIISIRTNSRLCLVGHEGKLHKHSSVQVQQSVQHVPGIPLAQILRDYRLSNLQKVMLSCILARAVWQYYESDWMKTRWTSETIQFMMVPGLTEPGQVVISRPYGKVNFGEADMEYAEYTDTFGVIHCYPRIRALGIMLVEIACGKPVPAGDLPSNPLDIPCTINDKWTIATKLSKEASMGSLDQLHYQEYFDAVHQCLDPHLFSDSPFIRGKSEKEEAESRKRRQEILYKQVVARLELLLKKRAWNEKLQTLTQFELHLKENSRTDSDRPMTTPIFPRPPQLPAQADPVPSRSMPAPEGTKQGRTDAHGWLGRLAELGKSLSQSTTGYNTTPSTLAILDTGCVLNQVCETARTQLRLSWKDFVGNHHNLDDFQDSDGHGTFLTSLILELVPNIKVNVLRVAENTAKLAESGGNIAKAIDWASTHCKADIISMSFGFEHEEERITQAIRRSVSDRDGKVTFFAAASNSGGNGRELFPACLDEVISIRATTASGSFETGLNPPRTRNEAILATLGMSVPSSDTRGSIIYKSGTSVSTALAAATAAMIMQYASRRPSGSTQDDFTCINSRLRTTRGMFNVLKGVSVKLEDGRYYLAPWKLESIREQLRWIYFQTPLLLHWAA